MQHAVREPLTPVAFLDRAAAAHGDRIAVIDGQLRFTYRQLRDRAQRLAGALQAPARGRPVAVLAPNTHVLLEAHYGVPWAAVPLLTLNTRLSAQEQAYIITHAEAGTLIYDHELEPTARAIARLVGPDLALIRSGGADDEYEQMLGAAEACALAVEDELGLLSLNYTSGTTGHPKGVMYHHRGAYLQSLAMVAHTHLDPLSRMLWTLPMFHCNGWCFTWAVTAAAGTHVCLRQVDAAAAWRLIADEGITHLNGAPTVLTMLAYDDHATPLPPTSRLLIGTGGAPPSPTILDRLRELNIDVLHLYGLTETFGPSVVCEWQPGWDTLDPAAQARLRARQGVANIVGQRARVVDQHGDDVPSDGTTLGEIALRGNTIMLGYLKDPEATAKAIPDGWFRTGDLAVLHPDGYLEIKDRAKDVIISGGENISSIEVEQALCTHPDVLEAAVIGRPDERWGEVPIAFVTLRPGRAGQVTEAELIEHVRGRLARFKAPKAVCFGELPKTSTGKIQKFRLREGADAG